MKNKNKAFTVDDFITFLKAKILIISLCTLVLSTITFYFQNNYKDEWKVKISRSVNKDSILRAISIINQKIIIRAKKYDIIPVKVNPRIIMQEIESLVDSALINYLTNEDIFYSGIADESNKNLFKKEIYQFKITNKDKNYKNENFIKRKLNNIFEDTNNLSREFFEIQYELGEFDNLEFYEFKIIIMEREVGYNYLNLSKIVLLYLTASIFLIFIFEIRKSINLF